jgi:hypothetical protein
VGDVLINYYEMKMRKMRKKMKTIDALPSDCLFSDAFSWRFGMDVNGGNGKEMLTFVEKGVEKHWAGILAKF